MNKRQHIAWFKETIEANLPPEVAVRFTNVRAINKDIVRADSANGVVVWHCAEYTFNGEVHGNFFRINDPLMSVAVSIDRRNVHDFAREVVRVMAQKDAWDTRHPVQEVLS